MDTIVSHFTRLKTRVNEKWKWVVLLCCGLLHIPLNGVMFAFGVMYPILQHEYHISATVTSWIGSISFSVILGGHFITYPLIERYGSQHMAIVGLIFGVGGIIITSFAPHPVVIFIGFSLCFGYCINVTNNCAMTLLVAWFPGTESSTAVSFMYIAGPAGCMIGNPLMVYLESVQGWRYAFRMCSWIVLLVGMICIMGMKMPVEPQVNVELVKREKASKAVTGIRNNIKEQHVYKDPVLWIWAAINMTIWLGLMIPFIHLVNYLALQGVEPRYGAIVMTIMSVTDIVGRLALGFGLGALKMNLIYTYCPALSILALSNAMLIYVDGFKPAIIYGVGNGIGTGPMMVSAYVVTLSLFEGPAFSKAWGFTGIIQMLGCLVGPSFAGVVLDLTGSYHISFIIAGCLFGVGALLSLLLSIIYKRRTGKKKLADIYQLEPVAIESMLLVTEAVTVV